MALTWPANCTTSRQRVEFAFIALEKLRKLHNFFGVWYREGKTETQWDKLPLKVRNRYPYKAQLTEAEFRVFQSNVYSLIEKRIYEGMNNYLENLRNSTAWDPSIEDIGDL